MMTVAAILGILVGIYVGYHLGCQVGFKYGRAYELKKLPKYIKLIDPNVPRKVEWYHFLRSRPDTRDKLIVVFEDIQ
jgi:hypothetical protein